MANDKSWFGVVLEYARDECSFAGRVAFVLGMLLLLATIVTFERVRFLLGLDLLLMAFLDHAWKYRDPRPEIAYPDEDLSLYRWSLIWRHVVVVVLFCMVTLLTIYILHLPSVRAFWTTQ
jgi:hypothetical protein